LFASYSFTIIGLCIIFYPLYNFHVRFTFADNSIESHAFHRISYIPLLINTAQDDCYEWNHR